MAKPQASQVTPEMLVEQAKKCLRLAAAIPHNVFLQMSNAASFNVGDSYGALQKALDYLTCKAQGKATFTEDEKSFLTNLFWCMSWGAYLKGGLGDSSKLAYQYIYGKGENVTIDSGIYTNSVIVKDAQ